MQTSYGRHDHRGRHRYSSRLRARQHGRDHRVSVGRVHDRTVQRLAAPAPPRTARRKVTYEASYPALAKGADHAAPGRAGGDEDLDGISAPILSRRIGRALINAQIAAQHFTGP